ncbi:MAG: hemolysin family protein [Firmicutes bacterium]|nr:hemolysin family protein [Blautia sp.]MDD7370629.1 hemolysin family protein [Bacillota bacterium]MDY3715670.1 hemolysin family protein [Blautia sp.]
MDDGSSPLWTVMVFALFIIMNGILYGFGSAIQRASQSELEKRNQEGDKKARWLLQVMDEPMGIINTTLIVGTLFSILTGYVGIHRIVPVLYNGLKEHAFFSYIPDAVTAFISIFLVLFVTVIILVAVGMISSKKLSAQNPTGWALRSAGFVKRIVTLFSPVTFLVVKLSNGFVRLFGVDPHKTGEDVTEEEIISMVDDAHEQGVIEESEAEMIQNIMEFSDKEAQDIMTHRKNIHAVSEKTSLKEALEYMLNGSNSRYPVYREDIDDIIGVIHLKDAMKEITFHHNGDVPVNKIHNLIREASYIPETRSINDLFKRMQAKKIHMAIVVDEYGQTSGIVTMEDILEEIVGNILDEYDEDDHFIVEQLDHTYLMKGLTPLEEVEDTLSIDLKEEEFDTLNGYLTSLLGHIPNMEEDKEIRTNGYLFTILGVENNTIQRVRVEKLPTEEGELLCQDIQNSQT